MRTFLAAFAITLFQGCKTGAPVYPPPENVGRQVFLSWPSLADADWPMNRRDPQSTGRSPLDGPLLSGMEWNIQSGHWSNGAIVTTADSLLLVGGRLKALRLNGSVEWTASVSSTTMQTSPIVRSDGVIIVGDGQGFIHAINPDSTLQWSFDAGEPFEQFGTNIGLDGTFYAVSFSHTLFAIDTEGNLKWKLNDVRFSGDVSSCLVFSPDGNTLYVPGWGTSLCAVDIETQTVKWTFGGSQYLFPSPLVDNAGNIYILARDSSASNVPTLFSLKPDGSTRWSFVHGNLKATDQGADPTIDSEGNIYFGNDTLYSVDYHGNLRWKIYSGGLFFPPLICDRADNIYAVVYKFGVYEVIAVRKEGSVVSSTIIPTSYTLSSSPALLSDRSLVMQGQKNDQVFKIK